MINKCPLTYKKYTVTKTVAGKEDLAGRFARDRLSRNIGSKKLVDILYQFSVSRFLKILNISFFAKRLGHIVCEISLLQTIQTLENSYTNDVFE